MSVTLLQLKNRSRQRADMEDSDFVADAELVGYINSSLAELHDLLVAAYGEDYFLADPYQFTTVSDTTDYALPADFYKMKGVDARATSGRWFTVRPFNFNERNKNQESVWRLIGAPNVRYRVMGSNIKFSPAPSGTFDVQLWYVPVAPTLADDTDEYNDINQYSEYVVIDTAIKMLMKEESDVSTLLAQKQALKRRLEEMANNRDAGASESVSDVYAQDDDCEFAYE